RIASKAHAVLPAATRGRMPGRGGIAEAVSLGGWRSEAAVGRLQFAVRRSQNSAAASLGTQSPSSRILQTAEQALGRHRLFCSGQRLPRRSEGGLERLGKVNPNAS